jgi:ubiquinone/menaquinone biosynthesis C-methylase UbiE
VPRIAEGAIPSPNIWRDPQVYELENRAVDPDGLIERTLQAARQWSGATVLDIGCGTGFHLPRFALAANRVIGVEPHRDLVRWARLRCRELANVTVAQGAAQALPVADASVDVAHARWAYFFGPGCEPGLRELSRVMRAGGSAFVIDNDATRSTFGHWFTRAHPTYDPVAADAFFAREGWSTSRHDIRWVFESRVDFERVVRIEFAPDQADLILTEHAGRDVDYAIVIRRRDF